MSGLPYQLRRFKRLHQVVEAAERLLVRFKRWLIGKIRVLPGPLSLGLPHGLYSDYKRLQAQSPAMEGRVVLVDQGTFPSPPDSVTVLARRAQHTYQPWPIFWTHLREVELVGTSLAHVDKKGLMSQEAIYGTHHAIEDPSYSYFKGPRSRAVRLEGNWTSLVSRWMSTDRAWPYGHWLKDALPRLAVLGEMPPDTRILVPGTLLPYQVSSLEMMGLLDRCRRTSETHLSVENYYFSSSPSMVACYSPYTVEWLRATFLPMVKRADKPMPKRFYLRRFGDIRNVANEAEVLDFFREIGWEIVDGAALSFPDQIRLFSQAEAVCGPHGSGFSNLIWCKPGCRVLEIFCDVYLCAVAEWICYCLPPTQHRYLIFPADHKLSSIVDIGQLRKALMAYDLI